jgi:hypothetical protein
MQIKVGDANGPATLVNASFPLGTAPFVYDFDVPVANQEWDIFYFGTLADTPGPQPDPYHAGPYYTARTRLNGFTLVNVSEPATPLLLVAALLGLPGGIGPFARSARVARVSAEL